MSIEWEALSQKTLEVMEELGNFGPTNTPKNREVKGCTLDPDGDAGKTYWRSSDLREIAAACIEVADWLDKRAEEAA